MLTGKPGQLRNVIGIIQSIRPDILLLNEFDHDFENVALRRFTKALAQGEGGVEYPYFHAPPPNTGVPSGMDLNQNGRLGDPNDAYGYGTFRGQYGMALLSKFPINAEATQDFSDVLWRQLPNVVWPNTAKGRPFLSAAAMQGTRLSSKGHWDVAVNRPDGRMLHILASHPTPPVFDASEDLNGLPNAAEISFWRDYLDGFAFAVEGQSMDKFSGGDFVIIGDLNSYPLDGDSNHQAIASLISHDLVQDPMPRSDGAVLAANADHRGDPSLDTADWKDAPGPGNFRVDYVLPSKSLSVLGSGVFWPKPDARWPSCWVQAEAKPATTDWSGLILNDTACAKA